MHRSILGGTLQGSADCGRSGSVGLCDVCGLESDSCALAQSLDQAVHTSAYDRIRAERGEQIASAAFDLVAVSNEEAGKQLRETSLAEQKKRRVAKRSGTGKRILRDSWLAPLTLSPKLSEDPQVHRGGVRASDKGFLNLAWQDYLALLRWTSKQRVRESVESVPAKLQGTLESLGIESSMWRDLVWNFKRYFGRASCAGSPESMAADAARTGKQLPSRPAPSLRVLCWLMVGSSAS